MRCETCCLGDVCTFIDYRGKTPPKTSSGIPLVTAKIVKNGMIQEPQEFIAENYYDEWMRRGIPQKGDVVFTTEAPLGEVARIKTDDKLAFAQRIIILEPNTQRLNAGYLFYALQDSVLKNRIAARATGTTVIGIKAAELKKVEIDLPPLQQQKKIADTLSSLDNKIELNNKINENLERQVAAIYKSWYQDFSRVANLSLVATEFGLIPQGWHYVFLGDICKSISVTHKFDKDKLVFLNTGDVEDGRFLHSNYMAVKDMPGQAKKTIAPGDILYSEIRPINRHFAYVNFPSEDYVVSTKLMVIRANGFDTRRLYHFLTSEDILSELQMQAESRSGTFPQIRFENVSKLPILIADGETEKAFLDLLHAVYDQIEHNNLESEKLATLRETLLPKLMSGEIDTGDVKI